MPEGLTVWGSTPHPPTAQRLDAIAGGWNIGMCAKAVGVPVSYSVVLRPFNLVPGGHGAEIEIRIDGCSVGTISNMQKPMSLTPPGFSAGSHRYTIEGRYYGYDRFGCLGVLKSVTGEGTIDLKPNAAFLDTGQLYITPQGYVMRATLIRGQ